MNIRKTRSLLMMVALAGSVSASAQDPRVLPKLDAPSKAAMQAVLDSAKAQGIPIKPLNDLMYEGLGKGADGPRIVAAVRKLAGEMAAAQTALGTLASADEIRAAASAMHAGVPAVELGKLKKQSGLRRSLTLPFTVVADIVSRGVPVSTAINAIRSLVGAGAKDKDIGEFQKAVKEDINQGAPPAASAETRAKSTPKPPEQQDEGMAP